MASCTHRKIAQAAPVTKGSSLIAKDWYADLTSGNGARRDCAANNVRGARAWTGTITTEFSMPAVLNMAQEKYENKAKDTREEGRAVTLSPAPVYTAGTDVAGVPMAEPADRPALLAPVPCTGVRSEGDTIAQDARLAAFCLFGEEYRWSACVDLGEIEIQWRFWYRRTSCGRAHSATAD